MAENRHSISQNVRDRVLSQNTFCLARFPGEQKLNFYPYFSAIAPNNEDYFLVKGWNKSDTTYYFTSVKNSESNTSIVKTVDIFPSDTSFESYSDQFNSFQNAFAKTDTRKAILSKLKYIEVGADFDLLTYFEKLEKAYPNALVYIMRHPTEGLWIGATPEVLMSRENKKWTTVSLAGTQIKSSEPYLWGEKEREEQEYVSAHIRATLHKNGIENYTENGPYTAEAGSVVHLKSIFQFTHQNADFDFLSLAKKLHPTPAISGTPIDQAVDLIEKTEYHKRSLYAGYLGRIGAQSVDLYVNLRCMQVFESKLVLYLGGGITQGSQLQSEWNETELKAETLLKQLNG